jgi:hypothetical protein
VAAGYLLLPDHDGRAFDTVVDAQSNSASVPSFQPSRLSGPCNLRRHQG